MSSKSDYVLHISPDVERVCTKEELNTVLDEAVAIGGFDVLILDNHYQNARLVAKKKSGLPTYIVIPPLYEPKKSSLQITPYKKDGNNTTSGIMFAAFVFFIVIVAFSAISLVRRRR